MGGFQYSNHNATTPQDLGGQGIDYGVGGGEVVGGGLDFSLGAGTNGQPVITKTTTVGLSLGANGHGFTTMVTVVTLICQ